MEPLPQHINHLTPPMDLKNSTVQALILKKKQNLINHKDDGFHKPGQCKYLHPEYFLGPGPEHVYFMKHPHQVHLGWSAPCMLLTQPREPEAAKTTRKQTGTRTLEASQNLKPCRLRGLKHLFRLRPWYPPYQAQQS